MGFMKFKEIKYSFLLTFVSIMGSIITQAQTASFSGKVSDENNSLAGVAVAISNLNIGTVTDKDGVYSFARLKEGSYKLRISFIGYRTIEKNINLTVGANPQLDFTLQEDLLNLSEVMVTGTRTQVERYNSPIIVSSLDAKTFEATQSLIVADGLNFSPGLRVENNCQNCGFTQLRMNGLDGAYSQILINSRPVFSALAGVYGLEMLPSNMVDRIEILRGGGSVMYGGNAISGTVNIITKDPFKNTFEVGLNQAFINGEAPDRTVNFNGSVVSEDLNKGITFFGFNRKRDHWDANGDGFSEMVAIKNNTFGLDAFYNLNDWNKIKLGAYYINEFRRGGNKFDLFAHQTDVTEQLEHDILSANLAFEHLSKNNKHRVSMYGSLQHVERASYYGGGGRVIGEAGVLTPDDVLAINAYGNSEDVSTVSGFQYNYFVNQMFTLTAGSEFIYNNVIDEMPGYGRIIDQQVGTWGTFAELEITPVEKLTFLIGGRFDQLNINGSYDLEGENFDNYENLNVFVPRISAMYAVKENLKLRASYAQGYRGPQAFDEDLHIETVGGAARFIRLGPGLEVEKSNSVSLSLNYDKFIGKNQMNFVLEGFYTHLSNPFVFANQEELDNGVSVITKRNGDGATVSGVNLEANIAFGSSFVLQSGATFQSALYESEEVLWNPENSSEDIPATTTGGLLRTPNAYGYFSLVYNPIEALALSYSGVFTGSMNVPRVVDVETERTIIETTPTFIENNLKIAYAFQEEKQFDIEFFGGVQNIFNSYQNDFDSGADRDAGYVYGPMRPRTFFIGLKYGLE
jgi:outer membrane receptor for ferrienterochelin and colicins